MTDTISLTCYCGRKIEIPRTKLLDNNFCSKCGQHIFRILYLKIPKTILEYLEEFEKKPEPKKIVRSLEPISLETLKLFNNEIHAANKHKEIEEAITLDEALTNLYYNYLISYKKSELPFERATQKKDIGWIVVSPFTAIGLYKDMASYDETKAWFEIRTLYQTPPINFSILKNFEELVFNNIALNIATLYSIIKLTKYPTVKNPKIVIPLTLYQDKRPMYPIVFPINQLSFFIASAVPNIFDDLGNSDKILKQDKTFLQITLDEMAIVDFDVPEYLDITESEMCEILTKSLKENQYELDEANNALVLRGPYIDPIRKRVEKQIEEERKLITTFDENLLHDERFKHYGPLDIFDMTLDDVLSIPNIKFFQWMIKQLQVDKLKLTDKITDEHVKRMYRASFQYTYDEIVKNLPYRDYLFLLKKDILNKRLENLVTVRDDIWVNVISHNLNLIYNNFRDEITWIFKEKTKPKEIDKEELITVVLFSELNKLDFKSIILVLKFVDKVKLSSQEWEYEGITLTAFNKGVIFGRDEHTAITTKDSDRMKQHDFTNYKKTTLESFFSLIKKDPILKANFEDNTDLKKVAEIFPKKEWKSIPVLYKSDNFLFIQIDELIFTVTHFQRN